MPIDPVVRYDGPAKDHRPYLRCGARAPHIILDPYQHPELGSCRLHADPFDKLRLQFCHYDTVAWSYHLFFLRQYCASAEFRASSGVACRIDLSDCGDGQSAGGTFHSPYLAACGPHRRQCHLCAAERKNRMLVCNTLYCGYGSTEGGTIAYAPAEAIFGMDRAVGGVAPWIEIEAVDEQNKALEYGKEGQIRIRALGQGYRYDKISPTEFKIDKSEWFYPGDQGIVFKNGMLVIKGRINEIINRGGTKVAPDTIEEELKKHPRVGDVAVVGALDSMGIEQIWVALATNDGAEFDIAKMFEHCRQTIPLYVPDRIFQVKEIPRNRLGKISRETLKEQLKVLEESNALTVR